MKSYDDELNDAIKKAFQNSFEDFEKNPKASIDRKIYKTLLQKPFWKRPPVIFGVSGLLLLIGFCLMNINGLYAFVKSHARLEKREQLKQESKVSETYAISPPALTHRKNRDTDSRPITDTTDETKAQREVPTMEKQLFAVRKVVKQKSVADAHRVTIKNQNSPEWIQDNSEASRHSLIISKMEASMSYEHYDSDKRIQGQVITGGADMKGLSEYEQKSQNEDSNDQIQRPEYDIKTLTIRNISDITIPLKLPKIVYARVLWESSTLKVDQIKSTRKKLDILHYEKGGIRSHSWIVNVSPTNTFQSIYLLSNAQSRILRVLFPNSMANLGYKFSGGIQAFGLQMLLNYSHLSWKAQYLYAIDEFKADEHATKEYVFERLGKSRTIKSTIDIVGIGVKKQVDFNSMPLGRIFARIGLDYSRSLQTNSQNFLSANISAGKTIRVTDRTSLSIGPYFEYNFTRVPTAEYSVKVRPNQLGLSLGLKFNKKAHGL